MVKGAYQFARGGHCKKVNNATALQLELKYFFKFKAV